MGNFLASQSSSISNEGPNDGDWSAEKNQRSVHISDPASQEIFSKDWESSHSDSTMCYGDSSSKGKLMSRRKDATKPDSILALGRRYALNTRSWNDQNEQLPSTGSHSGSLRSIQRSSNTALNSDIENLISKFNAALEEKESRYNGNSLKTQSGLPHNKVSTSSAMVKVEERKIQDYCSSQKMLLVGEGDFSFSACLAKAFGSAPNMVATSLNSEEYLRSNYGNAMDNIIQLRMRGCQVLHEVDATDMANHKRIKGLLFDRIVYNFPHSGDFTSTETALRKNRRLVGLFMENSAKMVEEDGEIHIRHKSNWFFSKWNLKGQASQAGLVLIEEAPFDASAFRGYNTKYGFEGRKFSSDHDFDCHSSRTYKFVLSKRQRKLRRPNHILNYVE